MNAQNLSTLLLEKETLKKELDKALTEVDQLKTLVAQTTIKTLYTQMDDEGAQENSIDIIAAYQSSQSVNKTYDGMDQQKKTIISKSFNLANPKSKKTAVPQLDFSILKHNKEYKDWF